MSSKEDVSVGSVAACCSPESALNQLSVAGRKRTVWSCHLSCNLFSRSPGPLVSFESMVNISRLQWTPSGASRLRKNINFSLISRGNSESLLAWSVARGCWTCAVCYLNSVTCDLCEKGTTCHWGVVWLSKMDGEVGPMMVSVENVSVGGCWGPLQPLCRKSNSSSICLSSKCACGSSVNSGTVWRPWLVWMKPLLRSRADIVVRQLLRLQVWVRKTLVASSAEGQSAQAGKAALLGEFDPKFFVMSPAFL